MSSVVAPPPPRRPVSGRTLDRVVDDALASEPLEADWVDSAFSVAPDLSPFPRDPFGRLFSNDFGQRAVSMIGNESKTLGEVGHYAANVLGAVLRSAPSVPFPRPQLTQHLKMLIVYHGEGRLRRSLLLLDPSLDQDTPPRVLPTSAIFGPMQDLLAFLDQAPVETHLPARGGRDASSALWIARPRVVIAPAPELINTCVPRPAGSVVSGSKPSATGAYARSSAGKPGVTVCYHGTGPVGTTLTIDGVSRTITLASQVLDTCFVEITETDVPSGSAMLGRRGLLRKRAPGNQEHHTFWSGAKSTTKEAHVVATDYGVPTVTPQRQLCIYTDAVTNYGDSGGALVNDDDELVAFSFQRTPFESQTSYSTWIWAHSAFSELQLQPI